MRLIQDYLGTWGRYQAFIYSLTFFPGLNMSALTLLFSFTGMTPDRRCSLGDMDSGAYTLNASLSPFIDYLYYSSQPRSSTSEQPKSLCYYCPSAVNSYSVGTINDLVDGNRTCCKKEAVACDGYVWDTTFMTSTMGMEWELVCKDAWKAEFAKSLTMIGFFIGAGLFGTLADRFGRKPIFLIVSYLLIITVNVVPVLPNFPTFCVFQIINGALSHGAFIICFNIAMELIGGFPGVVCGIGIQGFSAIGILYVGALTFVMSDWRYIHWATSVLTLGCLAHYWLLDESIRWSIVHGKVDDAERLMTKALKINKAKFEPEKLHGDIVKAEGKSEEKRVSAKEFFKDGVFARNTFIIFFTWFACSSTYYGLSFNTDDIPGDPRVNFMISTMMEIPGCLIVIPMLQKLGRKATISSTIGFTGVSILIRVALDLAGVTTTTPYVVFAALGRLTATGAFAVVYVYSAELFPTSLRNTGVGLSSMCARVGSSLSPQIHLLGEYTYPWVPSLIYGLVGVSAGLLDLFLPETINKQMPETVKDGIALHRGIANVKVVDVEPQVAVKGGNDVTQETGL